MQWKMIGALLALAAVRSAVAAEAYLGLPASDSGTLPATLSATGLFADLKSLTPRDGLIPYDINVPFWSDGADKHRWMAVPDRTRIGFAARGHWTFPNGSVFVKTFELVTDARHPQRKRRLETRVLVRDENGGVYGALYQWRADGSDADLLPGAATETIRVRTAGGQRTQQWYYPSREDCLTCHTALAGGVLGVNTRQLNHDTATGENLLLRWSRLGLFNQSITAAEQADFAALAHGDDTTRTLEDRARSWLDANCSQCHRPGGTVASFDARYETPPAQQQLIDGPVLIDQGIDRARVVAPHDPWRSILYMRSHTLDSYKMPPLARNAIDESGTRLLRQWIESLPGRDVVPPPVIAPAAGTHRGPVAVMLETPPGATIHYTLDGSAPTSADPVYRHPLRITESTVVRARAFAPGHTQSIIAQQVYVIAR